jgi:NADH dehydrogenase
VIKEEVTSIDLKSKSLILSANEIEYDLLIVAAGSNHHYFGKNEWAERAPGLKSIENALDMRRRIFSAFEAAELENDSRKREALMTFTVIGGGPTGVELAGAVGELANHTLIDDFRNINPGDAKIFLLEATSAILPSYPAALAEKAQKHLNRLGVQVLTNTLLDDINGDRLIVKTGDTEREIFAKTILWGAGVQASDLAGKLAKQSGAELDRSGRISVQPDLSLPGYPDVFVIGDMANFTFQNDKGLPGVAPVAMQQGRYVANLIRKLSRRDSIKPFCYRDKGNLAVIGRNAAIADFGSFQFSGFPAWLLWVFVHIGYLIEFDSKILVLVQWAWNYFTRKRGARLITQDNDIPSPA